MQDTNQRYHGLQDTNQWHHDWHTQQQMSSHNHQIKKNNTVIEEEIPSGTLVFSFQKLFIQSVIQQKVLLTFYFEIYL